MLCQELKTDETVLITRTTRRSKQHIHLGLNIIFGLNTFSSLVSINSLSCAFEIYDEHK